MTESNVTFHIKPNQNRKYAVAMLAMVVSDTDNHSLEVIVDLMQLSGREHTVSLTDGKFAIRVVK